MPLLCRTSLRASAAAVSVAATLFTRTGTLQASRTLLPPSHMSFNGAIGGTVNHQAFLFNLFSSHKPDPGVQQTISQLITGSQKKVVVFMKGSPDAPRCGFSNAVVQVMRMHGVEYDAHDVLSDEKIRQGIKDYTSWPTIPQIFINGQFVGGCDIILQMHQSGELIKELEKVGIKSSLIEKQQQQPPDDKDSSK